MIRFGTDGWRAVIAEEFTFENVRRVAQAYADHLHHRPGGRRGEVIVGYDTRFLSSQFAREAARVLAANGIDTLLAAHPAPTPAVSWAIRAQHAVGGIMITASHNPPEYNGVKIKGEYAGSALPELTQAVETRLEANEAAGRRPHLIDFNAAVAGGGIRLFDPRPSYVGQVASLIDLERIAAAARARGLRIVVDAMYGAGQGYITDLLAGTGVAVREIRAELNPGFGGINPEPILRNLGPLVQAVRDDGADLGLALDGDADRSGAVDPRGEMVDSQRVFALLLRHLVERRGWTGSVVKTFAVTDMVDKLAARYGLRLHIKPVGFKYVCELALQEDVLIGGEESGGLGIKNHIPERDGILIDLLLLEIVAWEGKPLHAVVDDLLAEVGPHHYRRADLHLTPAGRDGLLRLLAEDPPARFGGLPVTAVDPLDGFKFRLGDRGWILFRASGTEPVVRVYAELDDPATLDAVLEEGRRLALVQG